MLPLSEQQQKVVGTWWPLKLQVGPIGYLLPLPVFPATLFLFLIKSVVGSNPSSQDSSISFAANIIAQIKGIPLAAVKPKTVKWLSFVAIQIWGHWPVADSCFSPPTFPSFALRFIWSYLIHKQVLSGRIRSKFVSNPKVSSAMCMFNNLSFLAELHFYINLQHANHSSHNLFINFIVHGFEILEFAPIGSLEFKFHCPLACHKVFVSFCESLPISQSELTVSIMDLVMYVLLLFPCN